MKRQEYAHILVPTEDDQIMEHADMSAMDIKTMTFEEYQAALAVATQQAAEWRDRYLHAVAHIDNCRKQAERNAELHSMLRQRDFCMQLLELADNLERALAYARASNPLYSGIQATLQQLRRMLQHSGVSPIIVEPEMLFDPQLHEAIEVRYANVPDIIVVEVRRTGYTFAGQVLRPALVVVAQPVV